MSKQPFSNKKTPSPPPLPVIRAGSGWIAVDKPCHMSIHNAPGQDVCSLLNAYAATHPSAVEMLGHDAGFGFHAVHRLDKETSGILVLACRKDIFSVLARQFESRSVIKRYFALLHGCLPEPVGQDEWGVWRWKLGDHAAGRVHPEGRGQRQESQTRYRVIRHSRHYTWVECEPLTGRTHQIRRHAKLSGHAIVGDDRYGTTRSVSYLRDKHDFHRLALHAAAIEFHLPGASSAVRIAVPDLPREMTRLFESDL